ncbi:hypothetical protein [Haloferax sp. DFSO52]|uniref:hypothetical protein n=1 Tax=Haloferax sp. DFSO52 TaxID=3388505 RepID=UPI003A85F750
MVVQNFDEMSELYAELRQRVGNEHIHYKFGNSENPTVMVITYFPSHFNVFSELKPGIEPERYEQICEVKHRKDMFHRFGLFKDYFRYLFLPSAIAPGTWGVPSDQWLDVAYETCACKTKEKKSEIPQIIEERYLDILEAEIRIVDPQVVICAGEVATNATAKALLGGAAPTGDRITDRKYWDPSLYDTSPMMLPTVHWSAPKQNPNNTESFHESIAHARERLEPLFV